MKIEELPSWKVEFDLAVVEKLSHYIETIEKGPLALFDELRK